MRPRGIWHGYDGTQKPPPGWAADPEHPTCAAGPGIWYLNEGAGRAVLDALSGAAGSLAGNVTWTAGDRDSVLAFDGAAGSYVHLPRPPGLGVSVASLWCVAFAARYTGSGLFNVFNLGDGANGLGICYWYAAGNGLIVNRISGGASSMSVLSADPDVTMWHSYLVGYDGSQTICRIWVDGVDRTAATGVTLTPAVIDGLEFSRGAAGAPGHFESAMQLRYACCLPVAPTEVIARSFHAGPFATAVPPRPRAGRPSAPPPSGPGIVPIATSYLNRRRRVG